MTAAPLHQRFISQPPLKRPRRTATSVLAGDFDPIPPRDVLTSLLNGVAPYKVVEKDDDLRRLLKRERRERQQRKRARREAAAQRKASAGGRIPSVVLPPVEGRSMATPIVNSSTSSFWRTRGPVATVTRSVSPSPPPEGFSQPPTPGPSVSSSTSRTSSKRPRTPDDGDALLLDKLASPPPPPKQAKKRVAAKKGWKGWVEGSPPPSDKLINLDFAPVMRERKLRSGKHFDAISQGQDSWV